MQSRTPCHSHKPESCLLKKKLPCIEKCVCAGQKLREHKKQEKKEWRGVVERARYRARVCAVCVCVCVCVCVRVRVRGVRAEYLLMHVLMHAPARQRFS